MSLSLSLNRYLSPSSSKLSLSKSESLNVQALSLSLNRKLSLRNFRSSITVFQTSTTCRHCLHCSALKVNLNAEQ